VNVDALETSFDLVAPRGEELVSVFYGRLFERVPEVKPLFAHVDMARQRSMLLAALVLLRKSLRNLDAIAPKLRELGARHVGYGASPEAYPVVGEVLLASLAEIAGEAWNDELEAAWSGAYGVVAALMIEGAERAPVAVAA
jgi:nitric oxide dioxygenase